MEWKRVTDAQLAEKLTVIGGHETKRNLNNKMGRGGFSAAFLRQFLDVIGAQEVKF
ncbi:MAG: DUF6471 domain-containing protein [Albidovulum sp.]